MGTAGVVADHAAEGAVPVGGGVGGEGEVVALCGGAEVVVDEAGFDPGEALFRIELEEVVEVLREVEDDGDVAGLTGEGGAGAAGEDGNAVLAADADGGEDVFDRAGDDDADGELAIVGEVGGVDGTGAVVEADLGGGALAELAGELLDEGCGGLGRIGRGEDRRGEDGRGEDGKERRGGRNGHGAGSWRCGAKVWAGTGYGVPGAGCAGVCLKVWRKDVRDEQYCNEDGGWGTDGAGRGDAGFEDGSEGRGVWDDRRAELGAGVCAQPVHARGGGGLDGGDFSGRCSGWVGRCRWMGGCCARSGGRQRWFLRRMSIF